VSFDPLEPLSFSFNSPKGACPECDGLGIRYALDYDKIIDSDLSIEKGAIKIVYGFNKGYYFTFLKAFCTATGISITEPFYTLEEHQKKAILHGGIDEIEFKWQEHPIKRTWPGIVRIAYDIFKDEKDLADYMSEKPCNICNSHRLKKESLAVRVVDKGIGELISMPLKDTYEWFMNPTTFDTLSEQNALKFANGYFSFTMWGWGTSHSVVMPVLSAVVKHNGSVSLPKSVAG
jgi:excinuclease ABC subunit A